jgi:hypothetical protein
MAIRARCARCTQSKPSIPSALASQPRLPGTLPADMLQPGGGFAETGLVSVIPADVHSRCSMLLSWNSGVVSAHLSTGSLSTPLWPRVRRLRQPLGGPLGVDACLVPLAA